jgi:hypothetical protein
MKIGSAVVSFTDEEMNRILHSLDLPVSEIKVRSAGGKFVVTIKKGINFTVSIVFAADGRHLSATLDAGTLANPFVGKFLDSTMSNVSSWGVSREGRTLVFDPQRALEKAGFTGELRIEKIAVGAGELVMAIEGDLPLEQFLSAN